MTYSSVTPSGKSAGIMIAVCAGVGLISVLHHPSVAARAPADLLAGIAAIAPMDRLVHGVLIAVMGMLLFGFSVFALRVGLGRGLVLAGLIAYTIGVGAMIGAALIDGFLIPDIASRSIGTSSQNVATTTQLLSACALLIQILTKLGVAAVSIGIFAWSMDLVQRAGAARAAGIAGFASAAVPVAIIFAGPLGTHGIGAIVAIESIWYASVAALLISRRL